jgi:hypothetical protein
VFKMSKTKIEHVNEAFDWLRISGLTSNPTPKEIQKALVKLEDMMNTFKSRNICSSYIFEEEPEPNTDSGISSAYNEATSTSLAMRIAPAFGIMLNPDIRGLATAGMSNWSARSGKVNPIQPSRRQPRGSGNTFRFSNWTRYYRAGNPAPITCDTFNLKINANGENEIDFFGVDFTPYLLDGATIVSYVIESTNGINVLNDVKNVNIINLECQGVQCGYQTVTITVTTSTGRVNPETINFNITET